LIELNLDTTTSALNGGEDYELLFTIKQADFEKLKNHPEIATIGYMATLDTGKKLVTRGENVIELKAQGWVHM
jgi:thiamine-monophosphate kinase